MIYILLLGDLTFLLLSPHPTILYLCIYPNFALWFLVIFVLFFTYMLSCYCSIVFVTSENGIFSICICKCYYYYRKKLLIWKYSSCTQQIYYSSKYIGHIYHSFNNHKPICFLYHRFSECRCSETDIYLLLFLNSIDNLYIF